MVSAYRPPNINAKLFLQDYKSLTDTIICSASNKVPIIIGIDHNMDFLKSEVHQFTQDFIEMNIDSGIIPVISRPIRITRSSATLIDNIIISQELINNYRCGLLIEDISDHLPCLLSIEKLNPDMNGFNTVLSRKLTHTKMTNIKWDLVAIDWADLMSAETCQSNYNQFEQTLSNILDKHAPILVKTQSEKGKTEPWITKGLHKCRTKLKKLYREFLVKCDNTNDTRYKTYKYALRDIICRAKMSYYNDKCVEVKGNMKNLWFIINKAIGRHSDKSTVIDQLEVDNIMISGPKIIANEMAKYFANIGKLYADTTPKPQYSIDYYINKIRNNQSSIFLIPTTRTEKLHLINKLPNKKSCGPDGLSNCLLKDLKDELICPLEILFNNSLDEGLFPQQMKEAFVVPLHKGKSKYETSNYRLISLLMTMSKVLEKIMYKRVYDFLDTNNLIYSSQHSFRNKHSCESAVGELIGNVCKGHEKGKHTLAVFLDLSKAFDMISHNILFRKLERYGIRGQALDWYKSYLSNRSLRVKCKVTATDIEELSDSYDVTFGAPQGSCLGPLLFLIFTNDLHLILDHCQCILFADDTTIYITHTNLRYMEWCAQMDLNNLDNWFKANKLTLNASRSNCVLFHQKKNITAQITLTVNNVTLPLVKNVKFLGVWVDRNLDWCEHVNKLILKLKRNLNLLKVTKKC